MPDAALQAPPSIITEFERIARLLLDEEASDADVQQAVQAYSALLASITGLRPDDAELPIFEPLWLPSGMALSPGDSARCVEDVVRTRAYLLGLRDALRARREQAVHRPLQVVYAGTGPHAPLVLPLTTLFAPEEVQFTLLEVNPLSCQALARLLGVLDLAPYVRALVQTDATQYEHPDALPMDVLVIEAMQRALSKEPQVELALHLVPQLSEGGAMLPERVMVAASMVDPHQEFGSPLPAGLERTDVHPRRIDLGTVFELDAETARSAAVSTDAQERRTLDAAAFDVPDMDLRGYQLMLHTSLTVYGRHTVPEYASGLTHPAAKVNAPFFEAGDRLVFQYVLGPDPDLWCTVPRDGR